MSKLNLQDLQVDGKKILMRVDFNVPFLPDGTIADLTRIKESLPSIEWILKEGGTLILMSHLGRPKGRDPQFSLAPCAKALSKLLDRPVRMAIDCVGKEVEREVSLLKKGDILLLENLRFHPAEEKPSLDPAFAKHLATLGDAYVDDAFGCAHREHSSTWTVPTLFPGKAAAGFLMQKEIQFLKQTLENPKRPFYALIGGAKASTKMGVLAALATKTDGLFIGGAMAFTFYKAQGLSIGSSPFEESQVTQAHQFIQLCAQKKIPLWLPSDIVIADAFTNEANHKTVLISEGIPDGWQGMDIGTQTCLEWASILKKGQTFFWNGPFGVFELPQFAKGTEQIAHTLSSLHATTIVGGGDSVYAIHKLKMESHFTHLSTGGGASLEYIELGHLPGIDALSDKDNLSIAK